MPIFFDGIVIHQRGGQIRHRLAQKVLSAMVNLEDWEAFERRGIWRFGPLGLWSFHLGDFGHRDGTQWRAAVLDILNSAGVSWVPDSITLHAFPRFLGYGFNPMATWFCQDHQGHHAVIYEVSNTFGEHVHYVFDGQLEQHHGGAKAFHVSPFMPAHGSYEFCLHKRDEAMATIIHYKTDKHHLVATHRCRQINVLTWGLFMRRLPHAFGIILGIHWHAMRTWLKGAQYHSRPSGWIHGVFKLSPK
ncbi:MAG TPA: hypothetical protein DHV03_06180 [Alphaproteobacteria bacterium]|nr:hypothetical protein [Paracoccaceae bacterium]RCL81184.1 MAG: DUF1365 family protein [SAR116 cluster bacterium]RPH14301.1 MAG: DUF1365 family protein [Alphaproteobacteria bacterium TMED150]HBQ23187.1 hypothetical protein [Alphaproteobacteria bacterium]HCY48252.1 hypothetical protein [Alphaproteobacteria bacterium]|tara:strand:- start:558 stop:1295 length:738 start_codon:yes stop_codon:yes gene_type:complete